MYIGEWKRKWKLLRDLGFRVDYLNPKSVSNESRALFPGFGAIFEIYFWDPGTLGNGRIRYSLVITVESWFLI